MTMTPDQMQCVICQATPTTGFNMEPVEGRHGRVCATHALEAKQAGFPVAYDDRAVVNWPTRRAEA
jgi:hypothetical protein